MRTFVSLLVFLLTIPLAGQVINLDEKKGFKEFKIGDDLLKWKSQSKELGITNNTKAYLYQGTCCTEIIDYKVKEIKIFFDNKDKLVSMEIKFKMKDLNNDGSYLTNEVLDVSKSFKSLFGATTNESVDYGKFIFIWEGKTVGMALRIMGDLTSDEAMVVIRDIALEKKNLQDKF